MLILLSPSKTMDFNSDTTIPYGDYPQFIKESVKLVKNLKKHKISALTELMQISHKLAELNYQRYQQWSYPYNPEMTRPALAAFMGDVYEGLQAWEFTQPLIEKAQKHLRILSGLYGLLKPTDVIMPYRLEMGIPLAGKTYSNLYEFWGDKITKQLKKEIASAPYKVIINLASAEYAKAVDFKKIGCKVIAPMFLEFRNGEYRFISMNGKKARGTMTRYILENSITDVEQCKLFNYDGYLYDDKLSTANKWVFVR